MSRTFEGQERGTRRESGKEGAFTFHCLIFFALHFMTCGYINYKRLCLTKQGLNYLALYNKQYSILPVCKCRHLQNPYLFEEVGLKWILS